MMVPFGLRIRSIFRWFMLWMLSSNDHPQIQSLQPIQWYRRRIQMISQSFWTVPIMMACLGWSALTHAGMTTNEFEASVESWLKTAKHPRFGKGYDQLTFQPMHEVLTYLRDNGFKTFIVSGGGADFMRVWSERVYGIPPKQVVGSTARTKFELRENGPVLVKTLDYLFVDGPTLESQSVSISLLAGVQSPASATVMVTRRCWSIRQSITRISALD